MSDKPIYLDYAATTPVDPVVRDAMFDCLTIDGVFANSASDHGSGHSARAVVDRARRAVAERIGGDVSGVVFTSGATEANNLALIGMLPERFRVGAHLVTTAIEHHSVLETAQFLAEEGVELSVIKPDSSGRVDPAAVADAIRDNTRLVSVMHVNNEIGSVQDIERIAGVCGERGVPLHVDAAQSAGKLPLKVSAWGIALCSITAHKLYGPKGIGALYVQPDVRLAAMFHGGEQERGLRPGTLATHQIAGLGKAFELADPMVEAARTGALRDRLWDGLRQISGVLRNGDPSRSAPHILSVSFPGIDGESLRLAIQGIEVSQGSACASDVPEPSHVLSAIGFGTGRAQSTIRFGLGRFTTEAEVDHVIRRTQKAAHRLLTIAGKPPEWCST